MKIKDDRIKDFGFVCSDIDARCHHPDRPYSRSVTKFIGNVHETCIIDGSKLDMDKELTVVLRR
jgi:hypothetical protein